MSGATVVAATICGLLIFLSLLRFVQLFTVYHAQNAEQGMILKAYEWNSGDRSTNDANELRILVDLAISRLDFFSERALGRVLARGNVRATIDTARANLVSFRHELLTAISHDSAVPKSSLDTAQTDVRRLGLAATRPLVLPDQNIIGLNDFYSATLAEAICVVLLVLASGAFIIARLLASYRGAIRAENILQRDRDFSSLLLESSGDGVAAFDTTGRCTHVNSAMGRMFPFPGGTDIVGQLIKDAYRLPDGHVVLTMMRDTLEGQNIHKPAHLPISDRYVEVFTYPIRSREAIIGGVLLIRDVTDAHLARMQLVEHRDQLEATVRERTKDLEESLERETKLRELYKGFVSMVSHQFRTPLSIVDSSAQRMIRRSREMSEEEIRERARKIRTAILRMTRLVTSTLNAAKLDAGEIDFAPRRCDLGRLIVEACERQKETTPNRRFTMELDQLPGWVSCDPLLIDQVVANLLSNAVKYSSPPDPIEITAEVDERWIRIKVSDRGVGVPEDEHGKLFERFFRASTAVGIEGTGIGLHVARAIARMHGGDVSALPREGGGSVFVLNVPKEEALAA